jgi:ribosomal protein L20
MLNELLGDLDSVDQKIHRIEQAIRKQVKGYEDLIQGLCTIPGVEVVTSRTILADVGVDIDAGFPTPIT